MRTAEQIRQAMHSQPFRPFSIRVSDGSVYTVEHPDFIAIPPGGRPREICFFTGAGGAHGYQSHWIDLAHVVSVVAQTAAEATSE